MPKKVAVQQERVVFNMDVVARAFSEVMSDQSGQLVQFISVPKSESPEKG